ncbi:hypothetical protein GCM10010497_01310 [Streptomyces cinereoruber]|uniref:Integral membrane protein n=1 Tax=Streptomyces cinereoruber TaxID=67260 RepID=A0AAV4KC02_9ACTN|nr:DUF6114 domain-containing protein [Streptomyces cinereoruber]MBB4158570.1 hypothetical protein [Streptomyces cinereoruber]MBY8814523.1 DUF6114 domain-containing protein [Streptomyces cinereoruber]NIH59231.1 hypothetical protein [Streptomyces cinereoruber]QEV34826.1 hypothetical protein CP977_23905 [Streptomyces cinereoruber]GGR03893.1 hypothetical protein GCM10010497_01310 [Streptomyces cinereoruber]
MSAENPASREVPQDNRFKVWRQTRPFWAGLFTIIGGIPIAYLPYGDLRLGNIIFAMKTTAGSTALIIGVLLVTLGLTMWFQPIVRIFAGVAAIVLGLVSIPVSNFGGFVIGFLFALVGGGMSIAWAPAPPVEEAVDAEEDGEPEASAEAGAVLTAGLPEQRGPEHHATDKTIDANGGRNSAG